ncbi:hypothetical protein Purlil1_13089 [Purpureocillium lilacinum]|uniref:BTB domain-containing protein n=1 Tax=Purpureocillium lilacinum TaxID=33203 RepID=A0ABR0BF16_PURLI|nr:hypothetical protein Purlil1_13089 [Purpureocillium lilacinum]
MENCQPESLPLDPAGDVTLITNNGTHESRRAFLVSSKLLSLASPVFSKMFSPAFLEGSQIRSDCHPHINLEGDDPMAMEMMFRALHFLCGDIPSSIDPEPLATLAVHCDKYDCNEAMRPWILQWCGGRPEATTSQDFGLLLVAEYMFRAPTFPDIAARAAKHLVPGFAAIWEKHDTLTRLPGSIAGEQFTIDSQLFGL